MAYSLIDFMGAACCLLFLLLSGYIIIILNSPAKDHNYILFMYLFVFSISLACFLYYASDDLASGGQGFRGGDDRLWYEAGHNTLSGFKSGRSLYDLISNGVDVDWTSPLHPMQTIGTGRIGYPLLLAFIMGMGGTNLMTIMVINCFLGSLIPFVAYKIGTALSCPFDGRKSVLFASFSQMIYYAGTNYRDVHIGFLFALAALICVRLIKRPTATRILQVIILAMLIYLFRSISGLVMMLGLASLIIIFSRFPYKYTISIILATIAIIALYIEYPVVLDEIASVAIGQLQQTISNVGEVIGDESTSVTRMIMSRFIDSPLFLVFLPVSGIVLQVLSPPVDTTRAMWTLYLLNAVRFIFFLPSVLLGIYYIISRHDDKQLNILIIIYFIATIAYAPIAVFTGNRYMVSMVAIEAVFMGIGSYSIKQFKKWQIMWIATTLIYSIWHWIYKVTPIS